MAYNQFYCKWQDLLNVRRRNRYYTKNNRLTNYFYEEKQYQPPQNLADLINQRRTRFDPYANIHVDVPFVKPNSIPKDRVISGILTLDVTKIPSKI